MVLTSSESDQYSSAPKEISKLQLMYMTGYFSRSVYIYIISLVVTFISIVKTILMKLKFNMHVSSIDDDLYG